MFLNANGEMTLEQISILKGIVNDQGQNAAAGNFSFFLLNERAV